MELLFKEIRSVRRIESHEISEVFQIGGRVKITCEEMSIARSSSSDAWSLRHCVLRSDGVGPTAIEIGVLKRQEL